MIIYDVPIKIELTKGHLFVNNAKHQRSIRTLEEMRDVLQDRDVTLPPNKSELYYMFRKVYCNADIRYDIVFMPARFIGEEYNKTYGHYHPIAENDLSYPEVYQVLRGEALFMLQKKNANSTFEVIYISARSGTVLLIPPNYGHVSINESDSEDLILANIVYDKFDSRYGDYKSLRGAAFYYTKGGFAHNTNYIVRKFDKRDASDVNKKYGFTCNDLLRELYTTPEKFKFLEKPGLLFR